MKGLVLLLLISNTICVTSVTAPSPPPPPARRTGCGPDGARCCFADGGAPPDCPPCDARSRQPSSLFGCKGELWTAGGRLGYEWSWTGYRQGEEPLPDLPIAVNLRAE